MYADLKKENFLYKMSFLILALLPCAIVISTVVMNVLVVLLSISFVTTIISNKIDLFKKDIFFKILIIFFVFNIVVLFFSNDPVNSFSRAFGFIRFILLAYSLSYFISYKDYKYFKVIAISWLLFFIFISFDLIFEFLFGFNLIGISNQFPGRLSSFQGDELKIGNFYLGFALIISAIIYYFYGKKYFFISLIIFLIIALLIGERANFLKLFFSSIFLIFFMTVISKKIKIVLVFVLVTLPLIIIVANKDIQNRFGNQFFNYILENGIENFYYSSQYGAHFGTGIEIIKNYPLTGIGFKNFHTECEKEEYRNIDFLYTDSRCSTHPHQLHLDIASSVGILGYLILISAFIYLIFHSYKGYKNSQNIIALSGISFIICSLFLPLPSGSFFTSYGATIFWLNIGLILAFKDKKFQKN